MMKTAVSLPDRLFRAADRLAKQRGISRSQLYSEALQQYLQRNDEQALTDAVNRALAGVNRDPDPAMQAAQVAAMLKYEW